LNGRGDSRDLARFSRITRAINGGTNGAADRERRYVHALSILTDAQFSGYTIRSGRGFAVLPSQGAGGQTVAAAAPSSAGGDNPHLDESFKARLDAQVARGASGGVHAAPGDELKNSAQAPAASDTSAAASSNPSPEGKPAQTGAVTGDAGASILDEIPVNETTKAAGLSVLKRAGLRAGLTVGTLWGAGVAGKLLVLLAVVVVVGLAVWYWGDVRALIVRVIRKLKGGV
jgi:hypothetical protein